MLIAMVHESACLACLFTYFIYSANFFSRLICILCANACALRLIETGMSHAVRSACVSKALITRLPVVLYVGLSLFVISVYFATFLSSSSLLILLSSKACAEIRAAQCSAARAQRQVDF